MENLGKYLQDLRIKRDLSYKRIWEDLRIREDQIKSLEANRVFELGPYGVAKALVYNYARYLEADLNSVMHEFGLMMPDTTRGNFKPQEVVKEKKIMLSTNFLWTIGIILIVIVLGSILAHAYYNGWLQTPGFLIAQPADSIKTPDVKPQKEQKPDSLRQRMLVLSQNVDSSKNPIASQAASPSALADTTDYMGNLLGDSPLNVPLH